MDKELQNKVWAILPEEIKEDIRFVSKVLSDPTKIRLLNDFFGSENLNSDN